MIKGNRRLINVLIFLLFGVAPAFACTCFLDPNPPCASVGKVDAIFEAEVLSREKIEPDSSSYLRRRFTMKVRKTYKGELNKTIYVYTGVGDSDCGYRFSVGSRYLVYAYENKGRLSTGICSRTQPVKEAKEDIEYLSRLSAMPSGVTVYGRINKISSLSERSMLVGMRGVKIEINGPDQKVAYTDDKGEFSVSGLIPGQYVVKAGLPEGFEVSAVSHVDLFPYPEYHAKIADKGCLEVRLTIQPKRQP